MFLSCRVRGVSCRVVRPLGAVLVCAAWSIVMGGADNARAQTMTTQMIIGDAVDTNNLAKYTDVDEAIKRFINRDVLAARQFLETAKKKDPNLPPVDLMLAKMYFLAGNPVAGRAAIEKTAMDNPDDPEPYLILGDQAMQQGRTIEADALYEKGLEAIAKFNGSSKRKRNFEIRGRAGRAGVAQRRKNWDQAVSDLRALLKIDPENARAHNFLGQTLFMQKQYQEGYNEFEQAKKLDKNQPDPNVATALMYDQLKTPAKAENSFSSERWLRTKPTPTRSRLMRSG